MVPEPPPLSMAAYSVFHALEPEAVFVAGQAGWTPVSPSLQADHPAKSPSPRLTPGAGGFCRIESGALAAVTTKRYAKRPALSSPVSGSSALIGWTPPERLYTYRFPADSATGRVPSVPALRAGAAVSKTIRSGSAVLFEAGSGVLSSSLASAPR